MQGGVSRSMEGGSGMSTVSGRVRSGMRARVRRMSGMLGSAGALQTANGAVSDRLAPAPSRVVSWRALLGAALFSLALGAALYESLIGEHSSATPAGRLGTASQLRARSASHSKGLSSLPAAAQAPVSQALGAGSAAYRVSAYRGGFRAASPGQHLSTSFGPAGVSVSSGSTHLGLNLRAVGYGASL